MLKTEENNDRLSRDLLGTGWIKHEKKVQKGKFNKPRQNSLKA